MRDAGGVREWRLSGRVSAISEGCVLHPLAAAGTPRTYLPCVRFASTHVLPAPPSPTNTHLSCRLATRAIQGPLEKRGRDGVGGLSRGDSGSGGRDRDNAERRARSPLRTAPGGSHGAAIHGGVQLTLPMMTPVGSAVDHRCE